MNILERIENAITSGKTVLVSNYMHTYRITPEFFQSCTQKGHPVFKMRGDSLYMMSGRRYVCVDGCKIEAALIS